MVEFFVVQNINNPKEAWNDQRGGWVKNDGLQEVTLFTLDDALAPDFPADGVLVM